MAECILMQVGGGIQSDDLDATASNVLSGKKYMGSDTDSDIGTGTMANNGAVSKTFTPTASAQSYTVPLGYHNGSGKVTVNATPTQTKTINANLQAQTVKPDSGKFLSAVNVGAISGNNFVATNIKKGVTLDITSGGNTIYSMTGTYAPSNKAVMVGIVSQDNADSASIQYICTNVGVFYCVIDYNTDIKINGVNVITGNVNNSEGVNTGTNYHVQNMGRQSSGEGRSPFRFQPIKRGDVITITKKQLPDGFPTVSVMGVVVYD